MRDRPTLLSPLGLSTRKKALFATLTSTVVAVPLYLGAEIAYRRLHGIPIALTMPDAERDPRQLGADDTRAMDFDSVYYYEIFRKSENPALFYEPRPSFAKGAVSINADGFRDREFSKLKPPGTTRIAVLGDSIIWGHRLVLEDTFPKQLETLLAERVGGRFEVLNFGVSGYSLQQQVELYLSRAAQFHPDIVILGLSANDLQYSSVEGDYFQRQGSGLLRASYLKATLVRGTSYLLYRYLGVAPRYLEGIVDVPFHLRRLEAASPEVRWMVLMFPLLENFGDYRWQWYHDALTDPARDLGFVVRDLRNDFRRYPESAVGVDHIHPNRLGNAIAAEAALDTLLRSGLIRPAAVGVRS